MVSLGLRLDLTATRGGAGGADITPPLASGVKIAILGDSIFARGHSFTTAGARTTAANRANSEIIWARARSPRFIHENFWDSTATAANDIPTYGFASAQNNLYRGANFGYSGDTALGITRRVQQVINSGANACLLAIGTNTDTPNTSAEKIARIDQAVTQLVAANVYVILGTIRPRWTGERETLTNVLTTTNGSAVVRLVRANHGLTNGTSTTEMEFVSPGVTIANITLNGIVRDASGGYLVNVVDANTIDITTPTTANATVASGGGAFTWHRNVFVDLAGANNGGLGIMPSDGRHVSHKEVNDWIVAQAGRPKVVVCDWTAPLRDTVRSALTGVFLEPNKWAIMDGVHASAAGAAAAGAVLETAIAQLVQPGFAFNTDPTVSNLLTNGRFTGTAGTANGGCSGTMPSNTFVSNVLGVSSFVAGIAGTALTYASGTNPAIGQRITGAGVTPGTYVVSGTTPNWVVNISQTVAGGTAMTGAGPVSGVASVEANAETGGQNSVLALTSIGDGAANTFNTIRLSHTNPATGFVSTDWVQGIYEIELSGAESGELVAFQATLGQSSTISNRGLGQTRSDYNTEPYPTENRRYWIMTEPLLVEARTSLNLRLDLSLRADLAASVTVRVRRAFIRIVPAPNTQFPWVP